MNCQEFEHGLEDSPDSSLSPETGRECEEHAATCAKCAERLAWHRGLHHALLNAPRVGIPAELPVESGKSVIEAARRYRSARERMLVGALGIALLGLSAAFFFFGLAEIARDEATAFVSSTGEAVDHVETESGSILDSVWGSIASGIDTFCLMCAPSTDESASVYFALTLALVLLAAAAAAIYLGVRKVGGSRA
ncbi:MAG: hypothetical protein RDV41_05315 [Planctomycetota bacterium]|nr:hypothetical protein [Planctomycetota bacterium]